MVWKKARGLNLWYVVNNHNKSLSIDKGAGYWFVSRLFSGRYKELFLSKNKANAFTFAKKWMKKYPRG